MFYNVFMCEILMRVSMLNSIALPLYSKFKGSSLTWCPAGHHPGISLTPLWCSDWQQSDARLAPGQNFGLQMQKPRPNQGPMFLALGQGSCPKSLKLYTKFKPGSGTALSDFLYFYHHLILTELVWSELDMHSNKNNKNLRELCHSLA